ncbi:hypothetical protein [Brevundimonas sp.]|jgi:hypothetical protein|uniref:hypothetical protein n=1 Tax=Brevundimonas sp. TaxID=1871086 RepID=UPI0037C06DB9
MTEEEKIARQRARAAHAAADLYLCAGAGVCNASLITLLASADAFAARLQASTFHSAELSTLQLRQLAVSLADLQPAPKSRARDVGVSAVSRMERETFSPVHGAPVVT